MSLEIEISTLREAVEKLTQTIENQSVKRGAPDEARVAYTAKETPKEPAPKPEPTQDTAPEQSEVDPNEGGMMPTRKELTDIALGISRTSKDAKPKIKAILEEHGAATITKLDDDQLYLVWEKLEALKGEVSK